MKLRKRPEVDYATEAKPEEPLHDIRYAPSGLRTVADYLQHVHDAHNGKANECEPDFNARLAALDLNAWADTLERPRRWKMVLFFVWDNFHFFWAFLGTLAAWSGEHAVGALLFAQGAWMGMVSYVSKARVSEAAQVTAIPMGSLSSLLGMGSPRVSDEEDPITTTKEGTGMYL